MASGGWWQVSRQLGEMVATWLPEHDIFLPHLQHRAGQKGQLEQGRQQRGGHARFRAL